MVRAGPGVVGEWTSEGGPKGGRECGDGRCKARQIPRRSQVGADGHPTRYPSGRVWMVRESEWTYNVNLGGIAGAEAFVPCGARAIFVCGKVPQTKTAFDDRTAAERKRVAKATRRRRRILLRQDSIVFLCTQAHKGKLRDPFCFGEAKRPSATWKKILFIVIGGHHYEKTQLG